MLPKLNANDSCDPSVKRYFDALKKEGFTGDIGANMADRISMATDNSIYQILPQGVLHPKSAADIALAVQLANEDIFKDIRFSPRGGGTACNGQSLNDGVVIDARRHLNQILEINAEEGWARIQPGVVRDQLNRALAPHGAFFAPNLSPSSRATIGGMFGTDACGKGSRLYGKTAQHILSAKVVLANGEMIEIKNQSREDFLTHYAKGSLAEEALARTLNLIDQKQTLINETFPDLTRYLTGYNLKHFVGDNDTINPLKLLAGSEGTLAITTELTVKLTPIPKHKHLFALQYDRFDSALRAAQLLLALNPLAVETLDGTLLELAEQDIIYRDVAPMLKLPGGKEPARGMNLVEFVSDDPKALAKTIEHAQAHIIEQSGDALLALYQTEDAKEMHALWELRKKSVGLLGNYPGKARPIPFVEDTVVPPAILADYIQEFRAILDEKGLRYGMFGHVDVGCLHVRPMIDMQDAQAQKDVKIISDAIYQLVSRYQGLLWSEHGKGMRGCYLENTFGPELYHVLREIKTAFDPNDKLNPGKIATSLSGKYALYPVDENFRGTEDAKIGQSAQAHYEAVVYCNGNSACLNEASETIMCPSFKATGDQVHAPKARAALLREWLRRLSEKGYDPAKMPAKKTGKQRANPADFSKQVYDALHGCLGCSACTSACPIKVDIPKQKSWFLAHYHSRYRQSWRDKNFAHGETITPWLAKLPAWLRPLLINPLGQKLIGAQALPKLAPRRARKALLKTPLFKTNAPNIKDTTVALIYDWVLLYHQPEIIAASIKLLEQLGFHVLRVPQHIQGKALYHFGLLHKAKRAALKAVQILTPIAEQGIPIIAIEPTLALSYNKDYPDLLGKATSFKVQIIQSFLAEHLANQTPISEPSGKTYNLYLHCTERSLTPNSAQDWQTVFAHFGHRLAPVDVGCCGMAGVYGMQKEHKQFSEKLFAQHWKDTLDPSKPAIPIATGYSCRQQVKRLGAEPIMHPVLGLLGNPYKN